MNFSDMKLELMSRVKDLTDTRAGFLINSARADLDGMYLWPWREASVTGLAPFTVADLGVVETVTNDTQGYRLQGRQFRDLLDEYGDLGTVGTPQFYYRATLSDPVVATYPTSTTDTIGCQYWKVTAELLLAGDTPAAPDEMHMLIVDMAAANGYRASGNFEGAAMLQQDVERRLNGLLFQYDPGLADDPGHRVAVYGYSADW